MEGVPGGVTQFLKEVEEKRTILWCSDAAVVALSLVPSLSGELDLFCRVAVSYGPSRDAVSAHLPFLEKIARELGAKRIRFRSARRGWGRMLGSRWRMTHVEYETEVGP